MVGAAAEDCPLAAERAADGGAPVTVGVAAAAPVKRGVAIAAIWRTVSLVKSTLAAPRWSRVTVAAAGALPPLAP